MAYTLHLIYVYFKIDAVNLSNIDAIIISNYLSMLALPFITEDTGFKGTIYATDPTIQTGRSAIYSVVYSHWLQVTLKDRELPSNSTSITGSEFVYFFSKQELLSQ